MAAILRAVLSMSAATVLSRITGLVRTLVQAATLGTGLVAGSYALSNTLPNQIYELFMGGVLSSVFVPLLVERLSRHGEEDARRLTDALLTIVVPFLALVAVLGAVFAGPIVELATDWSGSESLSREEAREKTGLAVLFFRLFALQILLYGLGAVATGVLNAHRRFFLPTFAPVLNNLIVIASFALYAFLAPEHPTAAVYALALGTTLGVAVMSLVLFPAVYALGYRPRPRLGHPALRVAAGLAGPALVFVAAAVGVQVVANYLGSRYDGVEELWYAFTIFSLPYGVFVVSVATALAPELSERFARGDADGYRDALSFGLRVTAFIVVPASVGMAALSEPIVGLLLERGSFGARDTESVSDLLALYAAGLLPYAAYAVLVRAFYSRQNTLAPAFLNVGLFLLYAGLAYGLSGALGLPGVALAFPLAYAALALLCLRATRGELGRLDGRRLLRSLLKILAAGAAMYAVARTGVALLGEGSTSTHRLVVLAVVGSASLGAYAATALVLRMEELRSVAGLLGRRRTTKGS
ncbi:murein biosynthesis integral membrane protein MurJ [Rubrobacter marinus]|uniref:Probable lipid II flippase MurJ n=1 Tax=Rubrobacter marinus TaxID=2653852 RepID=A0A6G8PUD7_9ACTN|nr:murein biosynthesis integral membrane protein MurJ [Rubrobacter marinus]QIN77984.1 murein biosynthesis integral membrane protein MurJ [Rubrobacter marinus]